MKTRNFLLVGLFLLISSFAMAQITVPVNPLPTPVLTGMDPSTCGGNNGSAISDLGAGYSHLWSNGQTTNPATTLTAGTYTCVVTDLTTTCSSLPVSVTLSDPGRTPVLTSTATGNTTICAGTSVTYTATDAGATNFDFRVNGVSIQNGASANFTPVIALANGDIVSVITSAPPSLCTGSASITMVVLANPTATFGVVAPICAGSTVSLVVTPSTGLAPWSVNMTNGTVDLVAPSNINPVSVNGTTVTNATFTVRPTATTTYHFTVTDGNGCFTNY